MSPAAVRISSDTALAAPIRPKPAMTASVESMRVARAVSAHPAAPSTKPALITGVRPKRSIIRPAGTAVSAEAVRKIVDIYAQNAKKYERVGEWIDRIGWPRFFELTGFEFTKYHIDDFRYAGQTFKRSAQLKF